MIKNVRDIVLNVKPIFIGFEHNYYYEGPCRMASGAALEPGFDIQTNEGIYAGFLKTAQEKLADKYFNLLEPSRISCTDDWEIKEEYFETLLADQHEVDVYLVQTSFGANRIFEEFATRAGKPVCINPTVALAVLQTADVIRNGADIITCIDWPTVLRKFNVLRAQKVLRKANVLLAPRFNSTKSNAGDSGAFPNLTEVTKRLGTHFRYVNVHELMDQMEPLPEGGNPTTPGRVTPNITAEEIEECAAHADELIGGATETQVDKKFVTQSLVAHKQVTKLMDEHDCMAFTAPCPDSCSTRRLNEQQFTFCMTHSLNLENGFGSACEYDINASLCQLVEMSLTNNAPFMGNVAPVMIGEDGKPSQTNIKLDPATFEGVDDLSNLYYSFHSTPCRKLHGLDSEPDDYALRHFAQDAGFGALQRHDFDKDRTQKVTFMRFSNDLSEMLIGTGEVVAGFGYDLDSCNGGVVFRVADKVKLFETQAGFGLHLPLVYGDCSYELGLLAERLGMKPVYC